MYSWKDIFGDITKLTRVCRLNSFWSSVPNTYRDPKVAAAIGSANVPTYCASP